MSMLTLHAYGTWLPDKPEGYWHHTKGMQSQNLKGAERYRERQGQGMVIFTLARQRFMIETALEAAIHLRIVPICFASAATHLHAIVKWQPGRGDEKIRQGLKQTLARKLNRRFGQRLWFVRKGWSQKVEDETHLAHLVSEYLPAHPGWFWSRNRGWREPIVSEQRDCQTATRYGRGYGARVAQNAPPDIR